MWRNIFLSVTRQKIKSIILFLIICVTGLILLFSIALKETVDFTIKELTNNLGVNITIDDDYDQTNKNSQLGVEYNSISEEDIKKIGELDSVKSYDYGIPKILSVKNFIRADVSGEREQEAKLEDGHQENIMLVGFSRYPMLDVERNVINITQGEEPSVVMLEKGHNVVVISEELAKENSLNLGDYLNLDIILENNNNVEKTVFTNYDASLKIVGMFEINQKNINNINEINYQLNNIYVPNKFIENLNEELYKKELETFPEKYSDYMIDNEVKDLDEMYSILINEKGYRTIFSLKSGDLKEEFMEETKVIMDKYPYLKLLTTSDYYEKVSPQLNIMSSISLYILVGGITLASCVLIGTLLLFFKDRKKEFGIYLALGNSYIVIVCQVILELVLVATFALTFSLMIGYLLKDQITPDLFSSITPENKPIGESNIYALERISNTIISNTDVNEMYQFNISKITILKIYIYGISLIVFITSISLLYLKKLTPRNILL